MPLSTCVVDTKAVLRAVSIVKHLTETQHEIGRVGQILTSFDHRGLGITVSLHEGAARNNYAHILVDLIKCMPLMKQRKECIAHINELQRLNPSVAMTAGAIVRMLARILREGAAAMLSDCLAAMSVDGLESRATRVVYDSSATRFGAGLMRTQTQTVPSTYGKIAGYIHRAQQHGGCAGVLIQVCNSHEIFPSECMPRNELRSPDYTEYPPNRMGAFMLRALAHALRCCLAHDRAVIWAFTGVRQGAGDISDSFASGSSFFQNDLSGDLDYFDVEAVKKAISSAMPQHALHEPKLAACWKRLVGPPVVSRLFLGSAHSRLSGTHVLTSSVAETLLTEWGNVESDIVSTLYDGFLQNEAIAADENIDAEVAKFCAIVPLLSYTGHLRSTLSNLHSSVLALADIGLLRLRMDSSDSSWKNRVYFDRPYPLLLTLFVDRCGLPKYALGPLLRAMENLERNSQAADATLAEVAFACDLGRMFEGESRQCLLSSLGLKCLGSLSESAQPHAAPPLTDVAPLLTVVPSLSDTLGVGDERSIFVVVDRRLEVEPISGFSLSLKALTAGDEVVRLLVRISFAQHDDRSTRSEFVRMVKAVQAAKLPQAAELALSQRSRATMRTFCVFATPYDAATLTETVYPASVGEEGLSFFYFGREHSFWDSSPLNQFIKSRDSAALSSYLLGLLNLRHVCEQFRKPGDIDMLVFRRDHLMATTICSAKPDSRIPLFPESLTDISTCTRVYFDGTPCQIISSCVRPHSLTALSLLNPKLLNNALKLGLSESDLMNVDRFSAQYRDLRQDLPAPGAAEITPKGIAECLANWGTREPPSSQIEDALKRLEKTTNLLDVNLDDLSKFEAPMGAKLAIVNVVSWKKGSKENASPNLRTKAPAKRSRV